MRTPTANMAEYEEFSSPDPLLSSADSTKHHTNASKRTTSSKPSQKRSVNRKSQEFISILPPSSPARTVTEQTLSPWKIKVTVEAEPEDQDDERLETITRTIKIPLRTGSSPSQESEIKSRRSQPRSRTNSTSNGRRRSVTPSIDRRRRQSVTDLDIVVLGDDGEDDEWGKRSKKASPRKTRAKKTTQVQQKLDATNSAALGFEVRQDTDAEENEHATVQEDSPELRQIDLNRVSVRARANSTKHKAQNSDEELTSTSLKAPPAAPAGGRRTVSANSAMTYPTPSPTASERGRSEEVEEHVDAHPEGFDTIMESEGFTMIDLDSIPSVRQILSSPAENEAVRNKEMSPTESDSTVRRTEIETKISGDQARVHPSRAIPPHLALPEDESEISSTVPSSPPVFHKPAQTARQRSPLPNLQVPIFPQNRKVTPQTYSSPKLPSPPRQIVHKERSSPNSVKALRATVALQNAIQPPVQPRPLPKSKETDVTHSRSSSDELFDGFDSSTKRELRAGLRFGEELAKRPQANKLTQISNAQPSQVTSTQTWRGESVISRTPIQHLEQIQKKPAIEAILQAKHAKLSTPVSQSKDDGRHYDTQARREHQWQLEREAVSKQIQQATPSNVITIESDDEASEESSQSTKDQSVHDVTMGDDGDIWLEEAKHSSSSPRSGSEDSEISTQSARIRQHERAKEVVEKPKRSLIPSPWKRGAQTEDGANSTFNTNGDEMSGLMWQQSAQNGVQFGDAAISNVHRELKSSGDSEFILRRTSGAFDIEKMLGTPKRIRESLDRDQAAPTHGNCDYEENEADTELSEESVSSYESEQVLDQTKQTAPVKFSDSTFSQTRITPSPPVRATREVSPAAVRPTPPRSAMKGARQSFGAGNAQAAFADETDQGTRRVIFAERSKGVNVDWVESSSSVQLSTEDEASSPIVQHQKHQEERQLASVLIEAAQPESEQPNAISPLIQLTKTQEEKGWLGWFWSKKQDQHLEGSNVEQVDGTSEASTEQTRPQIRPIDQVSHLPLLGEQQNIKPSLPSYLTSPSYPSDPTRSLTKPLGTSGKFTNTHFRTLHILHRKSQRPRFHVPPIQACRPELRDLVSKKWKLEIDESNAGLGGFAWQVTELEARTLERFCREIEFDSLKQKADEKNIDSLAAQWMGMGGIWSGDIAHGRGGVTWGWNVEDLATWLGRIVVGDVVRDEEFGGKNYRP